MLIENSFDVDADPDRVFDFLQNPHNVATCFPGAELTEDLGDDSYRGKVKIKLGPVTAAFSGVAKITEKDATARVAVLVADGKDARGSGTAKATATMRVEPAGDGGASVKLETDLTISGKLAQFGRGIMADVSNRMVGELATRVRERIEAESAEAKQAEATSAGADATAAGGPAEAAAGADAAAGAATGAAAGSAHEAREGDATEAEATAGEAKAAEAPTGEARAGEATEGAPSEATEGAPSEATAGAPAGATTTEATTAPAAEKVTAPASTRSPEPAPAAGAIKASTLLKVMITGVFRRLIARLRGRGTEAPKG
jgi:carbon monoxide dehydrogenase subunit G